MYAKLLCLKALKQELAQKGQQSSDGAKYILMANQANSKKKVWQSSSQTYNDPALFVDAFDGNTDQQLKLMLQIQNFTIRFANTEPTYPYIVELQQPPTLIHIQSLSYETQISEVNHIYCDVRGREIGVYGAMFHVKLGYVSINNCTFKGPESVYDLLSTPHYHEILQRTAAVYLGIKCNQINISNIQYYGLYQRANQMSNDSSSASRGVAIIFKRELSKGKFIQLFNVSFERCWDVTTYLSGTATSACLIDTDTDELENLILGTITFKDCQFKSCRGRRCGAVFVAFMNKITSIQFMGCNFTDNDFTGAWPVVMGAHSRDVALFDEQKIDMAKSHYKDTEIIQNITGMTEIGFCGCLTTTSALQLSVVFQGVEGGSSSWLLSSYTFARKYYSQTFADTFEQQLQKLKIVGRGGIYAYDESGFGFKSSTPFASLSYALQYANNKTDSLLKLLIVNNIWDGVASFARKLNCVQKIQLATHQNDTTFLTTMYSVAGLVQPVIVSKNINLEIQSIQIEIPIITKQVTRPDLKDFCNAIEVSGINSSLLLNKVYMSTDSKEIDPKYWLRSFIRVSGGSVSINSCNLENMATLVSAVDINGSVKVILIDGVGFTNTIRRNVNYWGWAGEYFTFISNTNFTNCGNNDADSGAIMLQGFDQNTSSCVTVIDNCQFNACLGRRAGAIVVQEGMRLKNVNNSAFGFDCSSINSTYGAEVAQFIYFFRSQQAINDFVDNFIFNNVQFAEKNSKYAVKMAKSHHNICLIFALATFLHPEFIEFRRYRYDSSSKTLILQGTQDHDVISVDLDVGPYPFGDPGAEQLNCDRPKFNLNTLTEISKNSKLQYQQHYGINIIPSENCFAECGSYNYREDKIPPTQAPHSIKPYEYSVIAFCVNDTKYYGENSEDGQCKTQCVNRDPIEKATYRKHF
ncbi:MAG: hypothetical protein EZS28_007884 [Streblomastix strix]|uniref:Uncharacterized protein n=1 Tax=Streblomastix strix TaxID=222440 RepID=A0A5J4WNR3_9EUKA|nr:MAG: hypothetical protein EZS28_007884 [Streblomastix strix]